MKPPHYLASLAILVMLSACETTRDNTLTTKTRVKNMTLQQCFVPDRCETP